MHDPVQHLLKPSRQKQVYMAVCGTPQAPEAPAWDPGAPGCQIYQVDLIWVKHLARPWHSLVGYPSAYFALGRCCMELLPSGKTFSGVGLQAIRSWDGF